MNVANDVNPPVVFTQDELGWVSWIDPLPETELTERHFAGLVDRSRSKSEYFRLLVRDPEVLEARTKTDKDIFYNVADGLPRAEREVAAAATSRYNGCIYCASVHARFASTYSKRRDDVQRLLDEGVGADLGERWNAVVKASVALAATPIAFSADNIDELRRAGLDDAEIVDVINGASFFNWANRLMLSLGEPSKYPIPPAWKLLVVSTPDRMEPSMSNIDRRTLVKGSLAAMMAGAAFSRAALAQSSEPILLGVSGPLTGPNAQYGTQWKQGFDLALDEIQAAGGINGRKLAYSFEDSQSDPRQSVAIAQKFVSDPRIVMELGDFSSPASMAASPIYQRGGLVQFGFTNSHPDFTKGGDFMWSTSVSQADEQPLLAR